MDIPRNAFKRALAEGRRQIGIWSSLGSNVVAEILAPAGFDWVLLDMEHSPNEIPGLIQQMQALAGGTATPIVRPAWNDPVVIKRVLDAGAQSILVPFVQNAAEARAAVAATRYPPHGIRGVSAGARGGRYGRIDGYLHKANAEMCVLVQIETPMGRPTSRPSPPSRASTASSSVRPTLPRRMAISATPAIRTSTG